MGKGLTDGFFAIAEWRKLLLDVIEEKKKKKEGEKATLLEQSIIFYSWCFDEDRHRRGVLIDIEFHGQYLQVYTENRTLIAYVGDHVIRLSKKESEFLEYLIEDIEYKNKIFEL